MCEDTHTASGHSVVHTANTGVGHKTIRHFMTKQPGPKLSGASQPYREDVSAPMHIASGNQCWAW